MTDENQIEAPEQDNIETPEAEIPAPEPLPLDHFCYFENGLALKMVDAEYEASAGEKIFTEGLTREELLDEFPDYPKAPKYCAYDAGVSGRWVEADYEAAAGEILFDDAPTQEQLADAFDGYEDAAHKQNIEKQISEIIASITPEMRDRAILGIDNGTLAGMYEHIDELKSQIS